MAIFSKDDPRSLAYEERDIIIEKVVESFGFIYSHTGMMNNKKPLFNLENPYQANHWNRHKKGFLPRKYKDFSIMEYVDDGWNARHNWRYPRENGKRVSYFPYIEIYKNRRTLYISFRNFDSLSITQEEMEAFANGDETHADERSIATDIIEKINEIYKDPIKKKAIEDERKKQLEDERKKDEELYLAEMKKKGRKNLDIINAYRKKYGIEDKTPKRKEVNELRIRKK